MTQEIEKIGNFFVLEKQILDIFEILDCSANNGSLKIQFWKTGSPLRQIKYTNRSIYCLATLVKICQQNGTPSFTDKTYGLNGIEK